MFNTLSVRDWLRLSHEVRAKLKQTFGIKRSGGSLVEGNVVKSDGHTEKDLKAISIERMKEFTKLKSENFEELFKKTIELLEKK